MTGTPEYVAMLNRKNLLLPLIKMALPRLDWEDAMQMAMAAVEARGIKKCSP
jgi:hypothetical protein